MITFDELTAKFGAPKLLQRWGKCVVVPGADFCKKLEVFIDE